MDRIGVIYGSTSGDTRRAALAIADALGRERCVPLDVAHLEPKELLHFRDLVVGGSTRGIGDLQPSWWKFARRLDGIRFDGIRVACYGLGDQSVFPETFVDALGTLHDLFAERGATMIGGGWHRDGYAFLGSRAFRAGGFVGLALDDATQSRLTADRIARWTRDVARELA